MSILLSISKKILQEGEGQPSEMHIVVGPSYGFEVD